jgi:hypothetical protein
MVSSTRPDVAVAFAPLSSCTDLYFNRRAHLRYLPFAADGTPILGKWLALPSRLTRLAFVGLHVRAEHRWISLSLWRVSGGVRAASRYVAGGT